MDFNSITYCRRSSVFYGLFFFFGCGFFFVVVLGVFWFGNIRKKPDCFLAISGVGW